MFVFNSQRSCLLFPVVPGAPLVTFQAFCRGKLQTIDFPLLPFLSHGFQSKPFSPQSDPMQAAQCLLMPLWCPLTGLLNGWEDGGGNFQHVQ